MAAGIVLDTRLWPVVLHRVGVSMNVADMERYNSDMGALLARKDPFVSILLTKGAKREGMERAVIPVHGAWLKANNAEIKKYWLGVAFVLPEQVHRLVLSALLLAAPAATAYAVFPTPVDAGKWVGDILRKAGKAAPLLAAELAKE